MKAQSLKTVGVLALLAFSALAIRLAHAQTVPQWQIDAGGKMAFDVGSVKPNKSHDPANSLFPLGPGDGYVSGGGGLFSATNQPLIAYIAFAYKLRPTDLPNLPSWVYTDGFDIEARARGNPTKNQMRLMMQSLLADRFKLTLHTESKQGPVFALVLSKPGKIGSQLQRSESCSTAAAAALPTPNPQSLAMPCNSIGQLPASESGLGQIGGRGVTTNQIAQFLMNPFTGVDRPVFDRTGLTGIYDFSLEWSVTNQLHTADSPTADDGPTFLEALPEQLGLKLEPTTGPVDVLVIDHVEEPTSN